MIDLILKQLYSHKKKFLPQIFNACLRAWALYYMLSKPMEIPLRAKPSNTRQCAEHLPSGAASKAIATRKKAKAN